MCSKRSARQYGIPRVHPGRELFLLVRSLPALLLLGLGLPILRTRSCSSFLAMHSVAPVALAAAEPSNMARHSFAASYGRRAGRRQYAAGFSCWSMP
eukprot:SAG31_NODE_14525_length_801_cov_2.213675_1_plen_96_part_10